MGFQTNQKKSRKNIIKGGNRRRSASRRRPGAVDWLKSKLAPAPEVSKAPEVKKAPEAPEVLIGKFDNCNDYLKCLKSGQRIGNCNTSLDNTLLPEAKLNKACRQYKIYNDRGNLKGEASMRKYLETSDCDDTCTTYLWQDTLNN